MPRGSAPGERRGGRQKGTPNKLTADIKGEIERAFRMVGGAEYLVGIAATRPEVFCSLVGKVLPRDVAVTSDVGPRLADILRDLNERRRIRNAGSVAREPASIRDGSVAGHA